MDDTKREIIIKRWIELPKSVADRIAKMAEREHRTEKAQTEVLIIERVHELDLENEPTRRGIG